MSKNFIRQNIQNIKGTRKPPSIIEDQFKSRLSAQKTIKKYDNVVSHYKQPNLNNRVSQIQKKIDQIQKDRAQSLFINHITEIKEDIRMIKSHLFQLKRSTGTWKQQRHKTQSSGGGQQENIYQTTIRNNNRMLSQGSEHSLRHNSLGKVTSFKTQNHQGSTIEEILSQSEKKRMMSKKGLSIKTIYPILKQYKLQGPEQGTIFYGYSKRNSQPVAIKYVPSIQQANHVIEVYDKLWKNIAKAKWPCVNRLYDYKLEQNNFIVMQKNRSSIANLPSKHVLIDILKSLEFIHECGYLYRNIEPQHFMLNQQGQLTIVDFQRTRRYIDVKGHLLEVNDNFYNGSVFASNNQVRGLHEGRKDDLESLGYFALLLMGYNIPWYGLNKELTIKVRSTITLQELFKGHAGWIEYMATVIKTGKNDRPDYKKLLQILENL